MSLTGLPLRVVLIAGLLIAVAATVWLWPKLAGPRFQQVLGRVGVLMLVNILTLVAVGAQVNATYGLFADWSDLAGSLGGTAPGFAISVGASGGVGTPVAAADGRILRYVVRGPRSGITADVVVRFPEGYYAPSAGSRRYPVLETFQTTPGTPSMYVDNLGLSHLADELSWQHTLADVLIVSPETAIPVGADTECVNGVHGQQDLETWLTVDVPNWVIAHFRAKTDRTSWATFGMSSGGWCAAMGAVLHPDRYGAAIVFGGYFSPVFDQQVSGAPGAGFAARYDLVSLVRRHPPPVSLWLQTSQADTISYQSSEAFLAAARAPMVIGGLLLIHVGHRMGIWQMEMPRALVWLGQTESGFSAGRDGVASPAPAPGPRH